MAEQQKLSPEGPSPEDGGSSNNNAKEQKENGDGFKQRKRMRVPTSCSVCRKRKIKVSILQSDHFLGVRIFLIFFRVSEY